MTSFFIDKSPLTGDIWNIEMDSRIHLAKVAVESIIRGFFLSELCFHWLTKILALGLKYRTPLILGRWFPIRQSFFNPCPSFFVVLRFFFCFSFYCDHPCLTCQCQTSTDEKQTFFPKFSYPRPVHDLIIKLPLVCDCDFWGLLCLGHWFPSW